MPNDRTLGSTKTNINHGFVSVSVLRLIFVLMLKFAFDYLKRYFKGESIFIDTVLMQFEN